MTNKIITHNGVFHADEVFGVALILMLVPEMAGAKVIRTRNKEVVREGDWVIDVFGEYAPTKRKYDHHQDSNLPAACILVLDDIKDRLVEKAWEFLRKKMMPISLIDTGNPLMRGALGEIGKVPLAYPELSEYKLVVTYNQIISDFNRDSGNEEDQLKQFTQAVASAASIIITWLDELNRKELDDAAWGKGGYYKANGKVFVNVTLHHIKSWTVRAQQASIAAEAPIAMFYVGPGDDGTTILMSRDSCKWPIIDLNDEKNAKLVTQLMGDLIFLHKNLFFAKFELRDDAIAVAEASARLY